MSARMPTESRAAQGSFLLGGEPLVFHCHHYNVALQNTIEECLGPESDGLLCDAATEVVAAQLRAVLAENPACQGFAERLQLAAELSRLLGFGVLQIEGDSEGGRVRAPRAHYAQGYRAKGIQRTKPACAFHAGFVAAAFAVAAGQPAGTYVAEEVACRAVQGGTCEFVVTNAGPTGRRPIPASVGEGRVPMVLAPPLGATGHIDSPGIIQALGSLPLAGNEEGLIPAFGVYLTRHYANYYNRISYEFERRLAAAHPALLAPARMALIEAGHICAFHTFGGIGVSAEWDGLIRPQCRDRADWFHGLVACVNALGWGCWRTVELVPGELAVVDVYGSYESNGRLAMYGETTAGSCFLHNGGVAGLMNLLWVGDLTQRPTLDATYYASIYGQPDAFVAEEVRCRSKGDDRCTIVARRQRGELLTF